jgi:hypothetical protein
MDLKFNIVEMEILLKLIYRLSKIPTSIPAKIFKNMDKLILKNLLRIAQGPKIDKTMQKEANLGHSHFPVSKLAIKQ